MESNARYYSRRAVEERMKAQRAITEAARTWHAKLAHDFAERAVSCANGCDNYIVRVRAHSRSSMATLVPLRDDGRYGTSGG